jgi:hypothetical protein
MGIFAMSLRSDTFRFGGTVSSTAFLLAFFGAISVNLVSAQTVIYDGDEQLNFFSSALLNDDFALVNNPSNPDRAGIIESGADPNVLEPGDAAWFRAAGRRMRNTTLGAAGAAAGANGAFLSSLFDATGETTTGTDANGVGAAYVLYDAGATTGMQNFNLSMYYNDPTLNAPAPNTNLDTGGNVGIRIMGIQDTGDDSNPWGDDQFQLSAGPLFAGHFYGGGRPRANSETGDQPVVDRLFLAESSFDETENMNPDAFLTPDDEWQDLSFQFDAGDGYDYLLFFVSGVVQDATTLGVDRFGFDDISFGPAAATLLGDFDLDGDVDLADLDQYNSNIGMAASGVLEALDLDGDGTVGANDFQQHYQTLVETSNGGKGTAAGDVNLDGIVNVLGDAFALVGNLNNPATSWSQGDLNADGTVNVLGDAFALVGNLGANNGGSGGSPSAAAVPEPGSISLFALCGLGCLVRRRRN